MEGMNPLSPVVIIETTLPYSWSEDEISKWEEEILGISACVQRVRIQSKYTWKGTLQSEKEHLIRLKTTTGNQLKVIKWIEINHPYDVPEILVYDVQSSSKYAKWVEEESRVE